MVSGRETCLIQQEKTLSLHLQRIKMFMHLDTETPSYMNINNGLTEKLLHNRS